MLLKDTPQKNPLIHISTASPRKFQAQWQQKPEPTPVSGCAYFKGHEVEATVKALHSKIVLLRKPIEFICLEPQPIQEQPSMKKQDASTK